MSELPRWPSAVRLPQRKGFSYDRPSQIKRTQMESGAPRVRRASESMPDGYSYQLKLPDLELAILERFVEFDLRGGVGWFIMPLITPVGITDCVCRIESVNERSYMGGGWWSLRMTLIADESPAIETSEVAIDMAKKYGVFSLTSAASTLHKMVLEGVL